ncbi:uncharacterized protein LOC121371611 [Gigantopelta aegis]|uniref:uncharacterized protein LOC121371611 n=1 Tax=Gigantopelta aegis TaxID=1735272 RepID=UPI001B88DAF5|nr:uncharacterized protein LOC121371611 [Gigantopelta aegis]
MRLLVLLCAALYVSASDLSFSLPELAHLYRMQRLSDNFGDYFSDEPESQSVEDDWSPSYGDPFYSGTHLRDQEHLEQSSLYGYQSVSGGTAEGKQNQKQVKTDKPLPAYCNPPNPCPIGYTSKDNCVEGFVNSADNNKEKLSKQDCPCDTEHMFVCPAGGKTVTSKTSDDQAAINNVMSQLNKMGVDMDSSFYGDDQSLVAKKSPELSTKKRGKRAIREDYKPENYLLKGEHMTVAKKSPVVYQDFQQQP